MLIGLQPLGRPPTPPQRSPGAPSGFGAKKEPTRCVSAATHDVGIVDPVELQKPSLTILRMSEPACTISLCAVWPPTRIVDGTQMPVLSGLLPMLTVVGSVASS